MDSKRKPRQSPLNLPRETETQLSLLPDDNGTRKKPVRSARPPDGQEDSRSAEREAFHDQKALERFLKRLHYTADEWEMRRNHYLNEPRTDKELRSLTWKIEKERVAGAAVEVALERQKKLPPDLWMVAFLIAQGIERAVMPLIIQLKQRRVDMLIAELRSIVRLETNTDTDGDGVVARWFLGL